MKKVEFAEDMARELGYIKFEKVNIIDYTDINDNSIIFDLRNKTVGKYDIWGAGKFFTLPEIEFVNQQLLELKWR